MKYRLQYGGYFVRATMFKKIPLSDVVKWGACLHLRSFAQVSCVNKAISHFLRVYSCRENLDCVSLLSDLAFTRSGLVMCNAISVWENEPANNKGTKRVANLPTDLEHCLFNAWKHTQNGSCICLDSGLAPNMPQYIICSYDGLVYWRINVSLDLKE